MTEAIVGAVFVRDHRVLLVHRHPQRRWYPDCWDVVGGHVEAGESSQDALLRECREELGVEVLAFRGVDLGGSLPGIAMTTFLVTDWRGEPANTEPEEHDDLRWFTADQIAGLRLADPRIRTALRTLARDAPSDLDHQGTQRPGPTGRGQPHGEPTRPEPDSAPEAGTVHWDAEAYDALPLPHVEWGRRVVAQLHPRPGDRILDAGCGTGRDAALLLSIHPEVQLTCLDASPEMLAAARERLGERAAYLQVALGTPGMPPAGLPPYDAVMSVAAFHWVPDHDALFAGLAAVMRPGAPLVSDCGGAGQLALVDRAIEAVTGQAADPWEFAGVPETRDRLERAGLEPLRVKLRPDPLRLEDPDLLERYLATVILGGHLRGMPPGEHAEFVRAVRLAMAEPVVDYIRLEISARRR